jgi:hypothetical protein
MYVAAGQKLPGITEIMLLPVFGSHCRKQAKIDLPEVATEWRIGAAVPSISPVPEDDGAGNGFSLSGL